MAIFKSELERRISRKFQEIELKIKNSFSIIHNEINQTESSLEAMKKYLKNQDKQYIYAKNQDNKIRAEFRKDINEFTQKISQLKTILEKAKQIEKEVVIKPDLAKIEDNIKNSFKEQVDSLKEQIDSFKEQEKEFKKYINDFNKRLYKIEKMHNGISKNEKPKQTKPWFSFFKKKKQNNNP